MQQDNGIIFNEFIQINANDAPKMQVNVHK